MSFTCAELSLARSNGRARIVCATFATALAVVLGGCADDSGGTSPENDAGTSREDGGQRADAGGAADECRITWREDGSVVRVSMSDDAREVRVQFADRAEHHTFDERGLWVQQAFEGQSARAPVVMEYDAHGHLTAATEFGTPGNTCANTYDADDRIVRHQCIAADYAYRYDADGRIDQVTLAQDGGEIVNELRYDAAGLPTALENDQTLYTYAHDADGRLASYERDWTFGSGKDGTPDIRWTWRRGADGSVSSYEQDGTDHNDAPVIDGVADLLWAFSDACGPIGLAHPWLVGEPTLVDVGQPLPPFPF
jgi:YD repeat-containing protein